MASTPSNSNQTSTDALGITSIILAFIFSPAGLIVGLIGASKAKKENRSPTLSRIGWILSLSLTVVAILLFTLIYMTAYKSATNNAKRANVSATVSQVSSLLRENYTTTGHYPADKAAVILFLNNSNNISLTDKFNSSDYHYAASPTGCDTDCTGYAITASGSLWGSPNDSVTRYSD